ncbi:MAG: YfhO family protein [Candidatus Hydrogenedentes bacterium]|nr:YfhO family protein [Candidatus Hydrogenedentota bacterium]
MNWLRPADEIEIALPPTYRYGALPLFAIAVVFIVLAPVFWNETQVRSASVGEARENADLFQFFYPSYHYAFGRMHEGALPLWNSRQLCGTPLLADARVGVLQPLNLPFLFMSTEHAMALHAFMCLFMMGLFFALLVRAVGVGYLAALLGGMVYAFSGLSAAAMSRPTLAAAMVWTPLLLWAVREYAHRFDTASAIIAGITGALLMLSGAYAFALVVAVVAFVYAVQSLVVVERGSAEFTKRARGLIVIGLVAFGVSAVQWMPTLALALRAANPFSWVWGPQPGGIAPASLGEFFVQAISGRAEVQPRIAYVGVVPLVFIPAAMFHRHRRRDAVLYALLAACAVALAVFFRWRLPLQFPLSALMLPVIVSVALLTAIGADRVFTTRASFRSQSIWLPVMVTLAASVALFLLFGSEVRRYVLPIVPVLLLFAVFRARVLLPLCYVAIGAIVLIDLVNAGRTIYTHPRQDAPACFETYKQALASARDQSLGGRIATSARELDRGLTANIGMVAGLNSAGGAGLPMSRDQALWHERLTGEAGSTARPSVSSLSPASANSQLLRYMAARLLIAAPQSPMYEGRWEGKGPALREVSSAGEVRMFVLDDALPRAYWVPRVQVEVGLPATIDALTGENFDATQMCVVDAESKGISDLATLTGASAQQTAAARPNATCSVEDVSPERVVVRVDAPDNGVTVLCDTFDSGWSASIDGKRAPILKVNGIFRGIATPQGAHEIIFIYRPWSLYVGLTLACVALVWILLQGVRRIVNRT